MSRTKKLHGTTNMNIRISAEIANRFDLLLYDPIAERSRYGAKSHIVSALIDRLMSAARHNQPTINVGDLAETLRKGG